MLLLQLFIGQTYGQQQWWTSWWLMLKECGFNSTSVTVFSALLTLPFAITLSLALSIYMSLILSLSLISNCDILLAMNVVFKVVRATFFACGKFLLVFFLFIEDNGMLWMEKSFNLMDLCCERSFWVHELLLSATKGLS